MILTPAPVRDPTQWLLVPSFTSVARIFHLALVFEVEKKCHYIKYSVNMEFICVSYAVDKEILIFFKRKSYAVQILVPKQLKISLESWGSCFVFHMQLIL